MIALSPLDSASRLLNISNALYLVGAVFTALTAAWVVYETRAESLGRKVKHFLLSEVLGASSALICVLGSAGAIHYGNVVSHLKDVSLAQYEKQADLRIAQEQKDTAVANQNAHEADLATQQIAQENAKLRLDLQGHESAEKKTDAQLAAQTQQLDQFTQGLAVQQQGMAQQMQAAPSLNDAQVQAIAEALKPYAGQATLEISFMMDAHCAKLGAQLRSAAAIAGVSVDDYGTVVGPIFTGVMIQVKNATPSPHPPLADALLNALRAQGIQPHPSADARVQADHVRISIGPE